MKKFYPVKGLFFFLSVSIICFSTSAQITTFAGRHTYLGDNGLATNAGLFSPYAIARDAAGNLYIATNKDNRIRKVDATTKIVTTIAGTGIAGYAGDGGQATAAQLNFNPNGLPGIAVDNVGNIYIGDYINNRVRKINAATQVITTVAGTGVGGFSGDGGAAILAKLNGPAGITTDAAGNVYIVDNNNNVVRKLTVSTGIITTIAGNGDGGYTGDGGAATSATLSYPECIALDKNGNIYISDKYNSCIREVTIATGNIATVAGNGAHGTAADGAVATSIPMGYTMGVAIDTTGNIYFADQTYSIIRKVDASTKKISTVAGISSNAGYTGDGGLATSATISGPSSLLIDAAGNLYIDDLGNKVIREVTVSDKFIATIAGDGTDGFNGAPAALKAQLLPQSIAIDASGNTYIADGYYYDVRATNVAFSSYIYAGKPNPDPKYASKGYSGNGNLASFAFYNTPFGVAVDASNNVYIADVFNNVIRKITYSSKFVTTIAGTATAGFSGDGGAATSAQLNNPYGVAVDKNGNVYIADALNNRIRKVDASTLKISTIAGTGTLGSTGDGALATEALLNTPYGLAIDTGLNVFILDRGNNKIRMITNSTKNISTIFSNGHVLSGVATDGTGNIYVSDSTAGTVIKLTAKTYVSSVIAGNGTPGFSGDGGPPTLGQLNYPGGLAVTSAGAILVADINNSVIRKIIPQVVTGSAITNNIIATSDSVTTCSGSININTLQGSQPAGGDGITYNYTWLKSTDSVTYIAVSGGISKDLTIGANITATVYYRRLVTSGFFADSGNVISFHVYTQPAPVVKATALTICSGLKDTLSTTEAFTSYVWSTNATTSSIVDTVSGSFYVTVTDANGCTGISATVAITVNALPKKPVITAVPSVLTNLCIGTVPTLKSSKAPHYTWSTGATTQAIQVSAAGSYSVTITDANGCSNTSAVKKVTYKACGAPATASATNVTRTTVLLTWNKVTCAVEYRIQYKRSSGTTWTTIYTSTGDTTYSLSGLTKSTAYSFKVATICQVSPMVASGDKTGKFTTASSLTASVDNASLINDVPGAKNAQIDAMVYPNPTSRSATLAIGSVQGKVSVTISDMAGRVLWQAEASGVKELTLPAEKLAAGMYEVTLVNGKTKRVLKFIKQ